MFFTFKVSFDKDILAFSVWATFWLLFPKFGQSFPNRPVTLFVKLSLQGTTG
jgi:hypothetical protein